MQNIFFKFFFITLVCSIEFQIVNCQDKVIKLDGNELKCKIVSIDSVKIDMTVEVGENEISTYTNLNNVSSYTWQSNIVVLRPIQAMAVENIKMPPDSPPAVDSPEFLFADSVEKVNLNFVYTFTGQVIKGNNIELKYGQLAIPYLLVDSNNISLNEVKFYKTNEEFLANTNYINLLGNNSFSKRKIAGRINLYETFKLRSSPGHFNSSTGSYSSGMIIINSKSYYNKGFNDLKRINYKNLSIDLVDNSTSTHYLNKYQTRNIAQWVLGIAGGVLTIGGLMVVMDNNGGNFDPADVPYEALSVAGVGMVFCCLSLYFNISKFEYIKKAINTYNR